jgi:hypothetical protein
MGAKSNNFASWYEKNESKILTGIENVVAQIKELT